MISVIMTVYNVEKYIKKAISSVLNQTYSDIELIIVDDCSPDKSIEIAKGFNDDRIKFITNGVNMGAGYSRKVGIENAKGDYLITIDADDWVEPQFLQNLYDASTESDMTFGSMTFDFEDGKPSQQYKSVKGIFKDRAKFTPMQKKQIIFLNNCLVKRHLYDKVTYNIKRYNEDTPTLAKLLYYANQINVIEEYGYHYVQHETSLCHGTKDFYKHLCLLFTTLELMDFFHDKPNEYKDLVSTNDLFLQMSYLGDIEQMRLHQDEFNKAMLGFINKIERV